MPPTVGQAAQADLPAGHETEEQDKRGVLGGPRALRLHASPERSFRRSMTLRWRGATSASWRVFFHPAPGGSCCLFASASSVCPFCAHAELIRAHSGSLRRMMIGSTPLGTSSTSGHLRESVARPENPGVGSSILPLSTNRPPIPTRTCPAPPARGVGLPGRDLGKLRRFHARVSHVSGIRPGAGSPWAPPAQPGRPGRGAPRRAASPSPADSRARD